MSATSSSSSTSTQSKSPGQKWLFAEDQLQNTPSRRDNVAAEKELGYRQQAANLIQDMGQKLTVNQLTINTAIVYMHRFYMFHSFQAFSRFVIAPTALFLAAKVEEQPRKLEHVLKVCYSCLHPEKPHLDVRSDDYLKQTQQLVEYELILLQTLGFDISIDHPHTHVVKCTQLVKASRDLSQTAYFMATNSLHLTTFCLKYKPTVVSAMCIHLACKWSNYEIPLSSEGKAYWTYMDPTITEAMLENIINEFLRILNVCPSRLKKLKNYRPNARDGFGGSTPQHKDHPSKPSTSKDKRTGQQSSSDAWHSNSGQQQSEVAKKATSSLTFAEYKNKREKELKHNLSAVPSPGDKLSMMKGQHGGAPSAQHRARPHKPPPPRPGHSDGRPTPSGSSANPGLKLLLTESQATKHMEKIHPKGMNQPHKRPDKPAPPHKMPQQQPAGAPGLQRSKNLSHVPQSHDASQQHKELPKTQSQKHPSHHTKPAPPPRPKQQHPTKTKDQLLSTESANVKAQATILKSSTDLDDNLLVGMERKVMEQMKAEKSKELSQKSEVTRSQGSSAQPAVTTQHNPPAKEHKSRHSFPDFPPHKDPAAGHSQPPSTPKSYKALYEQYKKNPEQLRQQLKQKVQTEPLTEDEKQIWHKLKKKEEERQKKKRKHEKHKLNRSHPVESHSANESGNVTPGGGPLTVRIKLPPSVRAEISKNQASTSSSGSGLAVGSSSGSGSEAVISSPGGTLSKSGRKRTHAHDSSGLSDPISAKHSRKSETHHHQSHHSSHESSRHRHRHSHSGSHHHHSKSQHPGHKIDEATFQQALVDAVTMVQSGQTTSAPNTSEKVVPMVTLKRTGVQNGSGDNYTAHSSRHDKHKPSRHGKQHGFDPSMPVSATPPEDLFDGETSKGENHSKAAELSSPETGEIRDDEDDASPFRERVSDRSNYHQRDLYYQKPRSGANNVNVGTSHHQQWQSSSTGGYPPSHARRPGQHGKVEGHEIYENRLPPMPPSTFKPNPADQR